MPSFAFAGALLGLQFVAALDAEVSAGLIPDLTVAPDADNPSYVPSEPSLSLAVTPTAGWILPTARGLRFSALYSPQALWRLSDAAATGPDPLLIHRVDLTYSPVLKVRTQLGFEGNASVGDVDPIAYQQGLTDSQTTPIGADLRLLTVGFGGRLNHTINRRWSWQLSVPTSLQRPLGEDASDVSPVPGTESIGFNSVLNHALTRRDSVGLGLGSILANFETSLQLSTQLLLGWQRQLSTQTRTTLSAGAGRLDLLRSDSESSPLGGATDEPVYFAVGGAGISHTRQRGTDSLQLTLEARADPFVQAIRPQAGLIGTSTHTLSRRVSLSAELGASTVTTFHALDADPNETGINASLTCFWSRDPLLARAGIRTALRGPNLDSEREQPFELRDRLILAFVGVTWGIIGDRR